MQTLQCSEHYADKGHYAVMTRTTVLKGTQLARIDDSSRHNADGLAFSTNPSTIDNCRIAGTTLGWAYSLDPVRIGTDFDF